MTGKSASYAEKELPLTRSEYAICEYLALHAGQTFTKEQIYEAVFGVDGTADDTAITQHIKTSGSSCGPQGTGDAVEDGVGSGLSMEKRKLISLRAVLLGYLVQTAVSCIVAAVLWFLLFFCASTADGFFRPTGRRGSRTRRHRTFCRTGRRKHLTRLSWTRCAGMC